MPEQHMRLDNITLHCGEKIDGTRWATCTYLTIESSAEGSSLPMVIGRAIEGIMEQVVMEPALAQPPANSGAGEGE